MTRTKITFEGLYRSHKALVVCVRVETGGVPRFENFHIKLDEISRPEVQDLSSFIVSWFADSGQLPWADEAIPGIG